MLLQVTPSSHLLQVERGVEMKKQMKSKRMVTRVGLLEASVCEIDFFLLSSCNTLQQTEQDRIVILYQVLFYVCPLPEQPLGYNTRIV